MTLAMVNVFPEPVTPNNARCAAPRPPAPLPDDGYSVRLTPEGLKAEFSFERFTHERLPEGVSAGRGVLYSTVNNIATKILMKNSKYPVYNGYRQIPHRAI